MGNFPENHTRDQRQFPRINAQCPVLYLTEGSERWLVGKLLNMSATGLLMVSEDPLTEKASISIKLQPGSNKLIPAISGSGHIIRCSRNRLDRYNVSIKLTRIDPPKKI